MPPLLLIFLLLLLSPLPSPSSSSDLLTLLSIKHSLIPPLPSWDPLATPDHCRWPGVTCSDNSLLSGQVTSLSLPSLNLSGPIPISIVSLRSLASLNLSHNSLSGPIPDSLVAMPRLQTLDLSSNTLSGHIKIGPGCQNLTFLALSSNFLTGPIPLEIKQCANLKALVLRRNILEGRIPAEIGKLRDLRVLDVSKNSLVDRIPREIGQCQNLEVFVLTDLEGNGEDEFNAFVGEIPLEILEIPSLQILWAPRSNLDGRLVRYWSESCRLRVLNLGQNYFTGELPQWLVSCMDLDFLDLSLNYFEGSVPQGLGVERMSYFNVSQNSLSGVLKGFLGRNRSTNLNSEESVVGFYRNRLVQSVRDGNVFGSVLGDGDVVLHDFSWNNFSGPLPFLSVAAGGNFSYGLLLNDNGFNESITGEFFGVCQGLSGFAVNLSDNQLSGSIEMTSDCLQLRSFEAANNKLTGSLSDQLGRVKNMERVFLGGNGLSGEIPPQLGEMTSLRALDLSRNSLVRNIPKSLANAIDLEVVLLDHNLLSGEIPDSFSRLARLATFDVSFNNLSGKIPHFDHITNCDFFKGNNFLRPCPDTNATGPSAFPINTDPPTEYASGKGNMKALTVAVVVSTSVIVSVLVILVLVLVSGKRKLVRLSSLKQKVVVVFSSAPPELNYECVVRATKNFSIQNLIGAGGFGATYKAELVPGYLVAVKRLSAERFQGLQQFDAEIRTLGKIRHKNLVTLIGYHMGETDTFLIYNYLSGGNLEAFIRNISNSNVGWPVIHKIATDVAQALVYLHYSCVPRIVHRDIKPSNILLDDKLNAYLSDFGLARLLEVSETHATTAVAGTFGYVAPEYAMTCRVSNKADVYSYGVVLLELVSGKRLLDSSFSKYGNGFTIVSWGRLLIQEGRSSEFFCQSLWETAPQENLVGMLRLALSCTVESLTVRPSMKQVHERLKLLKS